ncbi:MAG: EpsG family protein [Sphingomonadaceae bacterium]
MACYLGMFFFVHEYTQLRMAVALAFALLAAVAFGNGRWINAGLGLLAGALFHSSVLVIGLAFALYLLLSSWRGAILVAAGGVAALTLLQGVPLLDLLTFAMPILSLYIDNAADFDTPNPWAPGNLLVAGAAIASIPKVMASRDRLLRLCLLLTLLGPVSLWLLLPFPVFAVRFWAIFSFFVIPLSFRRPDAGLGSIPALLTLVNAAWGVRNAVAIGLVGQ